MGSRPLFCGLLVLGLVWPWAAGAHAGTACATGPGVFDYGPHREDGEAEHLAMNLTGQLRAPDAEYERIRRDLAAIREAYPVLESLIDDPEYRPDGLIVVADLPLVAFDELNTFYQVVDIQTSFGNIHFLTFCDTINAFALEPIYDAADGISATPDSAGGDDQVFITDLGSAMRYEMYDGFGDCAAGCFCNARWLLDVDDAGEVTLVSFEELGPSQCEFPQPACCETTGACEARPIGACLQDDGLPLNVAATCDGDPDGDGRDGACGDNCPHSANPGFADADADGHGNVCDNCVYGPNPSQGSAPFGQTVRAEDLDTFSWASPADAVWVRGDLLGVGAYPVDTQDTLPPSTAVIDTLLPMPGEGFYFLLRPDCAVGTWATIPGAEPGRDAVLP